MGGGRGGGAFGLTAVIALSYKGVVLGRSRGGFSQCWHCPHWGVIQTLVFVSMGVITTTVVESGVVSVNMLHETGILGVGPAIRQIRRGGKKK